LLTTIVTKLVLRMRTCSLDPKPFKYNEVSSYLLQSTFLPTQKIPTCKYSSKYRISIEKLRTGNFLKNDSQKKKLNSNQILSCCFLLFIFHLFFNHMYAGKSHQILELLRCSLMEEVLNDILNKK